MLKKIACVLGLLALVQTAPTGAGKGVTEWAMWGGSPDRNMVSDATGLPTSWDTKTGKNIKWVAALGSQSYGNPTIAGGVVLIGTNNEALRDPKQALVSSRECPVSSLQPALPRVRTASGRA